PQWTVLPGAPVRRGNGRAPLGAGGERLVHQRSRRDARDDRLLRQQVGPQRPDPGAGGRGEGAQCPGGRGASRERGHRNAEGLRVGARDDTGGGGEGGDLPLHGGPAGDDRQPGGDVRMNRPGKEQLEACRAALAEALGPSALKTDPDVLSDYGKDESDLGTTPADLVVLPRTTEEVSRVLKIARAHRVPVTPSGARSGKSGGSMPVLGGVVLSIERMNTIRSISTEDLVAVVEPGVVTGDL